MDAQSLSGQPGRGEDMSFEDDLDAILVKGKEKAAQDILKAVESTYGEIPYVFQFMQDNPEILITKVCITTPYKEVTGC
jgi:hypothetical protein